MNRIRACRKAKSMRQQDLAEKLNVARSTIAMWENEKSAPDLDALVKLADVLEVSTDYLLGKDDELNAGIKTQPQEQFENIDLLKNNDLLEILNIYNNLTDEEKVIFKNMLSAVFAHRQ